MPTRKRTTKSDAATETARKKRAPAKAKTAAAKPRRARAAAKQAVNTGAVAAPQKQLEANEGAGRIARKLIKDNPRALSLPEWARQKPLPRTGTAASALLIVATKVVGLGRDLLGKVWGER